MKTSIDALGRVLVPAPLRRRAGLEAGAELEASYQDGRVVLEPRPMAVQIQKQGRFYVARPAGEVAALPSAAVAEELADLRVTAPRATVAAAPAKKKPTKKKSAKRTGRKPAQARRK